MPEAKIVHLREAPRGGRSSDTATLIYMDDGTWMESPMDMQALRPIS